MKLCPSPDGFVTVPDKPGLGVTLSEVALQKYTRAKLTSTL